MIYITLIDVISKTKHYMNTLKIKILSVNIPRSPGLSRSVYNTDLVDTF